MDKEYLKKRTKDFGLRVIKMLDSLPKTPAGRAVASQIVRSATSVGANYRAACRGAQKLSLLPSLVLLLKKLTNAAIG